MSLVRVGAFILLFFHASSVEAQGLRSYGLHIGANKSTVVGVTSNVGWRTGFHVAGFAEVLDLSVFSLVTEVGYYQRGFVSISRNRSGENEGQTVHYTTTLHYISIPVLARLRFLHKSRVMPYMVGGPRLDILIGRNPAKFEFSSIQLFTGGVSRYFDDLSYSGVLGVGAALDRVVDREMRIELRYIFGVTDLLNGLWSLFDARTRSIDLSVGVAF